MVLEPESSQLVQAVVINKAAIISVTGLVELENYIDWLEHTLIPDLEESGYDQTALDLAMCAELMARLSGIRESKG